MARERGPLGAILAGGKGRRMGTDKALIQLRGSSFLTHVAAALSPVVGDVVVVGRAGTVNGLESIADDTPGRLGPLAGLATALRHGIGADVVLVAVDQPFLRTDTVRSLNELSDGERAVVPIDRGVPQVTCAVYPGAWAERAARATAQGESIQSLLDEMPWRGVEPAEWQGWGEDGRSWFSVDTPDDLAAGAAEFRP